LRSIPRILFFVLVVRPLVLVMLGLNIRHRERLPLKGPAIIAANHNSHLDTLVLMALFPIARLKNVRPVGASDYFFRNRYLKWFSLNIMGMIPIIRDVRAGSADPLQPIGEALGNGDIVIIFPEGSRGEPEQLGTLKSGIAHLSKRHQQVPVVPVFMHGCGKALPRGEALFVPVICDVFIAEPLFWTGQRSSFMEALESSITRLACDGQYGKWH
jgi:1-acyl-sn-glycerol-3-phosphate acyltransferase